MRRLTSVLLASASALTLAACSMAAVGLENASTRWYWTQTHAENAVVAKVRIRCLESSPCASKILWHVRTAVCTGADELRQSFTFPRFSCAVTVTDYYGKPLAKGHIAVYVTGSSTFRWKVI